MADSLVTERPAAVEGASPLLRASAVCKTYRTPDHTGRLVLDRLDFGLKEGEIVAISASRAPANRPFCASSPALSPRARARSPIAARP